MMILLEAANAVAGAAAAAAPAAAEAAGEVVKAAPKIEFGIGRMLEEGGAVTWAIFLIMVLMSAVSWYIMITKYFEQNKLMKQSRDGVGKFWSAGSLRDGGAKLEKNSALRQLVDDGLQAEEQHTKLTDPVDQHEWMLGSLARSQNLITNKLGSGLPFLATVGSTAPFVGLLGTVIGILDALLTIGMEGDASIDKVAGPVGEALIMTAIGLIVAVPAVMGYNWLLRRNKLIGDSLSKFSTDLHGYMMSGGAVRPAVKASGAAAKPAAATSKA